MQDERLRAMTLGYHYPGDYHYYMIFPRSDMFMGDANDTSYQTIPDFLGLVTAAHEHFHLMQSMISGYVWWRSETQDALADSVAATLRRNKQVGSAVVDHIPLWKRPADMPKYVTYDRNDPLGYAQRYAYELDFISSITVNPELTRSLVEGETQGAPFLRQALAPEAYQLTTMDLIEGQAALATEWFIENQRLSRPERFDSEVVEACADSFRVERLPPTYGRALRIITHLLDVLGLGLTVPPDTSGPYASIDHGSLYPLLIFLIDYALHLPPYVPEIRTHFNNDGAAFQDIYPPFRFINLSVLLAFEIVKNPSSGSVLLNENTFYGEADAYLAELVNTTHDTVRPVPHKQASPDELWAKSFFSIAETTRMWETFFAEQPRSAQFSLLDAVQRNCLRLRKEGGSIWLEPDLLGFNRKIDLPIVVDTPHGLRVLPYFSIPADARDPVGHVNTRGVDLSDAELTEQERAMLQAHGEMAPALYAWIKKGMQRYVDDGTKGDWDNAEGTKFPHTLVPWPYFLEVCERGMYRRGAHFILEGKPTSCPLMIGVGGAMRCDKRSASCANITSVGALPTSGCRLRDMLYRLATMPTGD